MGSKSVAVAWRSVVITVLVVAHGSAEPPSKNPDTKSIGAQEMLELKVRVVDAEGEPVVSAKVTPWALRSSQGHGWWRKDDEGAGVGPKDAFTDSGGMAVVLYPNYRDRREQIHTISVSLNVDHPEFAYIGDLHIDVPLEQSEPHVIKLASGVPLEVRARLNGEPIDLDSKSTVLDSVFVLWSDGRSHLPGSAPQKMKDGGLRIPSMPVGENSVLLAMLDGDRATHFSTITNFTLRPGEPKIIHVNLQTSVRVQGILSSNVERPVRRGRVKAWTLNPAPTAHHRVRWSTWAPIQPDGTFTIDGWPPDESMQLIAVCDGYIATSGQAPDCVKNPPDPDKDSFIRPQVFQPEDDQAIELAMTPLVLCAVSAVDEDDVPVAGVSVESWPNVCWWNGGSQIYCHPLERGERMLRVRDYFKAIDETFPNPFQVETDANGKATLELPAGGQALTVTGEVYELPAFLGSRDVSVKLTRGETSEVVLHLQRRGTEKLGEWDKLAGVVFGCSTREGRRICALPGISNRVEELTERFRAAENQRDPLLLSEAFTAVADAFIGVGDLAEAARWQQKSSEQRKKAKSAGPAAGDK